MEGQTNLLNLTSTVPTGHADTTSSTTQVPCSPVASFVCGETGHQFTLVRLHFDSKTIHCCSILSCLLCLHILQDTDSWIKPSYELHWANSQLTGLSTDSEFMSWSATISINSHYYNTITCEVRIELATFRLLDGHVSHRAMPPSGQQKQLPLSQRLMEKINTHLVFLSWSLIFFSISASVKVSSRGHHWSASPVFLMAISTVGSGFSL